MKKELSRTEIIDYIIFVIRKRLILLISIGLLTFALILFLTYLKTPTWEGSSTILIERSSKQTLSIFKDFNIPVRGSDFADNFNLLDILNGQNTASRIVEEFALDERLKNKRLHPKEIRSKIKNFIVDIILSPITLLQKIGLMSKSEKNWHDKAVEDFLNDWTDIEAVEGTSTLEIVVNGETPVLAMDIANRMVDLLIERTQEFTRDGARGSYNYLAEQLSNAEEKLGQAESAMSSFMKKEDYFFIEEEKKMMMAKLGKFETELLSAQKRGKELEARLDTITKELEKQKNNIVPSTIIAKYPIANELQSSLINMEIKLASVLQEKRIEHPDVMMLKAAIQKNEQKLNSIVQNVIQSRTESINPIFQGLIERVIAIKADRDANIARENALEGIIKNLRTELYALPEKELEWNRLQRTLDLNRSVYNAMKGRMEKLAIEQQSMINEYNIRILDSAYVSKSAESDSPNWLLTIIIGMYLSLVFSFGSIFIFEYFNDAVTFPQDVEKTLAMPLLGSVPAY